MPQRLDKGIFRCTFFSCVGRRFSKERAPYSTSRVRGSRLNFHDGVGSRPMLKPSLLIGKR